MTQASFSSASAAAHERCTPRRLAPSHIAPRSATWAQAVAVAGAGTSAGTGVGAGVGAGTGERAP